MRTNSARNLCIAVLFLWLAGCNLPASEGLSTEANDVLFTQAAETIIAQLTVNAPPTVTPLPPFTETREAQDQPVQPAPSDTPQPAEPVQEATEAEQDGAPSPTVESAQEQAGEGLPTISATVNTNCRYGPAPVFKVEGYLLVGDESKVHGQDPWGYWWYIENPDKPGGFCWVWRETTVVEGDTSNIPVVQPPPTPTPTMTPSPTLTPTDTNTPYP